MEKIIKIGKGRNSVVELVDGTWWNLDFGDTEVPGVTRRSNLRGGTELAGRLGTYRSRVDAQLYKKIRVRSVPALEHGDDMVRVMVRAMSYDEFYMTGRFAPKSVNGL